jgi:hypothetical protein
VEGGGQFVMRDVIVLGSLCISDCGLGCRPRIGFDVD